MNESIMARRILERLRHTESDAIDLSSLTDAELDALIASTPAPDELTTVRRVSGGRTGLLAELTDEELDRIIQGLPPLDRNSHA